MILENLNLVKLLNIKDKQACPDNDYVNLVEQRDMHTLIILT